MPPGLPIPPKKQLDALAAEAEDREVRALFRKIKDKLPPMDVDKGLEDLEKRITKDGGNTDQPPPKENPEPPEAQIDETEFPEVIEAFERFEEAIGPIDVEGDLRKFKERFGIDQPPLEKDSEPPKDEKEDGEK